MTSPSSVISKTALCAAAALLLSACAGNGPANIYGAIASLPEQAATVVLTAPGLPREAALRALYQDNSERQEYVLYRSKDGAQAEIFTDEASPYGFGPGGGDFYTLEFNKITRETVAMWNMATAARPVFGESVSHKGALPYYLQPFTRQDTNQSCFGFHSEFNLDVSASRVNNPYDNQLFGYYCAPMGTSLDVDDMAGIIDGLSLVGTTAKMPIGAERQKFRQLRHDAVLAAKVTRGDPVGETGLPGFPFFLLRQYGSDGGDSKS